METKYPAIRVKITGCHTNQFAILGACNAAAKEAGLPDEIREQFFAAAMNSAYEELLRTARLWFTIVT